jgi:hypothetical protein
MEVLICATLASPSMADVVVCDLSGLPVRFEIDRTQFAPAIDRNEPERRRITTVQMGESSFAAEPILMDGLRGFWAETPDVMLVMQSDGTTIAKGGLAGSRRTGTCEVLQ